MAIPIDLTKIRWIGGEIDQFEVTGQETATVILEQDSTARKDEYSNVADAIIADINRIAALPDHAQARQEFLTLLEKRGRYMSPGLRLEVEAQLIGLE